MPRKKPTQDAAESPPAEYPRRTGRGGAREVREPVAEARATLRRASYLYARRAFPNDAALAEAFPVSPSRVARWKQGHLPDEENARLLRDLGIVVALLDGWLEEETVPDWLHGLNAHLGHRRPLDVVREGRLSEVVRAIEAEKAGAYA
jgi:hypothetical protein